MIAARREPAAALLLIAFGVLWAIRCVIAESPSSLHQDMLEAYIWGQEFQLGYNQHPPFWAWMCGLWFAVFPRSDASFAVFSALNSTLGLWGAWKLVGRFARGDERVAATALLVLTPFYTFHAYKYNANSIFVSVWPWALYFYDRTVERRRIRDALALGLFVAAALLSKYFALILVATMLIAALTRPDRKTLLASPAPYVAAAFAAALIAPHIVWLVVHKAPPLRYLGTVSGLGPLEALNNMQMTLFGDLADLAAPIALVAWFGAGKLRDRPRRIAQRWREPRFRELTILAFAPLALALAAALVMQVKLAAVMLIGAFPLAPLWFLQSAEPADPRLFTRVTMRLAAALMIGALAVAPGLAYWNAWRYDNPRYVNPQREIAAAATEFWRETTGLPLVYVAGTRFYDDATAFYGADKAHGFTGFERERCPWVTPEKLAASGLLAVCVSHDAHCLDEAERYGNRKAKRTEITVAHTALGHTWPAENFTVIAIPPQ